MLNEPDFQIEGSNAYGHIDGYEVNVIENKFGIGPIFIFSTYLTNEQKAVFCQTILAKKINLLNVSYFEFGVTVTIGAMTAGGFPKKYAEVMPLILSTLSALNAPKSDVCPTNGVPFENEETEMVTIPGSNARIRLTKDGLQAFNEKVNKENEDFKKAPNNYMKGFWGVFLGGLVGVAIAVILGLIGFISFWAPLVSILLGTHLYKKFGGKPNATMIVMSFVTTIVMIVGVFFLMYTSAANAACLEAELPYKGINALNYCLENSEEFRRGFYLDLGLNALFAIIAEGCSIAGLVRQIRRPQNI